MATIEVNFISGDLSTKLEMSGVTQCRYASIRAAEALGVKNTELYNFKLLDPQTGNLIDDETLINDYAGKDVIVVIIND